MTSSSSPAGTTLPKAPTWAWLAGTFFGAGLMKPGPGTWGSAFTVIVWALVAPQLAPEHRLLGAAVFAGLAVAIGIPAATLLARASGRKDPQFVVIDETAGQMVTLLGAPISWPVLLVGFLLFRAFDIVKPPPVRQLERLPEGTGIVVDDLAAGVYGLLVLQALLYFGVLPH